VLIRLDYKLNSAIGLDHYATVPLAAQADLEIGRIARFGMKASIAVHKHLFFIVSDEGLKGSKMGECYYTL